MSENTNEDYANPAPDKPEDLAKDKGPPPGQGQWASQRAHILVRGNQAGTKLRMSMDRTRDRRRHDGRAA